MLGQRMEEELREQPTLLQQNWAFYDDFATQSLQGKDFDLVLLVARGSSDNAALYARYLIEIYLGIPVVLAAPSVLTRYNKQVRYPKNTLAIGISQSGAAPDVSEVMGYMRESGHTTFAITNTPKSKITELAEFSLLLNLKKELAVAATKTYSASLLALYAVCRGLKADLECPQLPDDLWVQQCGTRARVDSTRLPECENLFTLARGIRFCSAEESALKLMECALLPCLSYSQADFEHGPKALASDNSAAIVYGEPPSNWRSQEFHYVQAPERAGVPEAIQPIWDAIFAQWLALIAARQRDLDPDKPEGLLKVTKTL
jgi:glucosamine--fructose-6-phosphate aminotransferase (isomerizing)